MKLQIKQIPSHARASIRQAGEQWDKFLAIWDTLTSPESDQLIEDFGPFYAQFRLLQRLGVPFDIGFITRTKALHAMKSINLEFAGKEESRGIMGAASLDALRPTAPGIDSATKGIADISEKIDKLISMLGLGLTFN